MPASERTEVVVVKLRRCPEGYVVAEAPVLIYPEGASEYDSRLRQQDSNLILLSHFKPGELEARFNAKWDGDRWTLYDRVF